MRKKILIWMLLLMLCMAGSSMAASGNFRDVAKNAWYAAAVETCVDKQMISGTTATTFSPDQPMTRAQFVTVLGRMDGATGNTADARFADVPQSAYYARYVIWAADSGIVQGTGAHSFSPQASITRQQMATMVAGYLSYKKTALPAAENPAAEFEDADRVAMYAKPGVETLRLAGLLRGNNNCVQPEKTLTRAEGAAIFVRLREQLSLAGIEFPEIPPAEDSLSPLCVSGTHLTNQNGEIVQLKGVSTHGLAWYPQYVNAACFRQLHDEWNVNVVRLAMYTEEYGGYCAGGDRAALKELLYTGAQYAADAGMYAILDWHILSDGNPNTHLAEAKEFFGEMSSRCSDMGNVLYEICNEPNDGTTWAQIKQYALQIIPVIRANDPDAVILIGTPTWSQQVDLAAADPITGYSNLMYTLHFYAATHTDSLRATLTEAVQKGLPVFVSEFGICDASGQGALDIAQANQWMRLLDRNQISCVAWNLSNKAESCALLQTGCTKTSRFGSADLSPAGQWFLQMMHAESSDTPEMPPASEENGSAHTGQTMPCTATITNHWTSGDRYFYQLEITIQNNSGAACSGWSTELPLSARCELSQGWNAEFTADNTALHLKSVSYNADLAAGAKTTAGCIVSCTSPLML